MSLSVLHITTEYPPMTKGGIANAAFGMVSASVQAGIETAVVLIGDYNSEFGKQLSVLYPLKDGVNSKEVTIFLIPWENAIKETVRLVKMLNPDLLHLHTFLLFPIAYAIKNEIGTRMVHSIHALERAYFHDKNPLEYLLQSQTHDALISLTDLAIVLSQTDKELLSHYRIKSSSDVRLVNNGARKASGSTDEVLRDHNLVLYVGRFDGNKGIEDLLTAIPYVVQQYPDANFVLVGGPYGVSTHEIRQRWLSNSFPCCDRVTFTGWVPNDELTKWYRKAGILVSPSTYDTCQLVVLDGMQYGLAVIASSIGGALDIIKHGRTGLLFTPKDIRSLVNCIVMLLKDPDLQHNIGNSAACESKNSRSWSNIVERLMIVYKEAIQRK
jgi:1,4-alpha-glucan branching enzyme